MRTLLGLFAVMTAFMVIPAEVQAQCALCKDPWYAAASCSHCSGGNECGEQCKFDHAGNCYYLQTCGSGGLASLADVLRLRGVDELPAGLTSEVAATIGVEEVGDALLVARNCEGEVEHLWHIAGAQVLAIPLDTAGPELVRARRALHLHAMLD